MSNPKKKREAAERRAKREQWRASVQQSRPSEATVVRLDIAREISYITERAQAADSRVVRVGKLVLFSTWTKDAWLLDPEDELAVCVCRSGKSLPIQTIDTPNTVGIYWTAEFSIEGAAFIVKEKSGRIVEIAGYPTKAIAEACWS